MPTANAHDGRSARSGSKIAAATAMVGLGAWAVFRRRASVRHLRSPGPAPGQSSDKPEGFGQEHPDWPLVVMGRHSYNRPRVIAYHGDTPRVIVGSFTSIADDVEILTGGNNNIHTISSFPFRLRWSLPGALEDGMPWTNGDVQIGNDVWIGRGALILSGVTVGDGAVIGARAVVAADVRPYAVIVGNPAREVRRRFPDAVVDQLLAIRWWDWPDEVIATRIDDLNRVSADSFLSKYSRPTMDDQPAVPIGESD